MAKQPNSRMARGTRAQNASQLPRVKPFAEMGVSGTPVYAGYVMSPERDHRLIGQEKWKTFSDIMTNTSIVAAGIRYFLNIIARPTWTFEPADETDAAQKAADFMNEILDDLHTPFSRVVRRAGTYRFHGFNVQEWIADKRDDGLIGLHDIESRPQWTIWRWETDLKGTVTGVWQRDPLNGVELGLPRGKLIYLVDDTLTDSPEGMGLLRHCAEPAERLAEYLDEEAVGFLRDLRGIPIGKAPMDELDQAVLDGKITKAQRNDAIETLQQFCRLEKKVKSTSLLLNSAMYTSKTDSGVTIANAPKWGIELMTGGAPGLADAANAINRINQEMARILGVEHLLLGSDSAGSFALAKEKASALYMMANSVLRDIKLQFEHDIIKPIWSLNGFPDDLMPIAKTEDVQPKDVAQIATVLREMATAGSVIPPDDEVQNFVRDLLGAPQMDLEKMMQMEMERQKIEAQQEKAKIEAIHEEGGAGATVAATGAETALEDADDIEEDEEDEKRGKVVPYGEKFKKPRFKKEANAALEKLVDVCSRLNGKGDEYVRKVIGNTAGDYIHDFVHSTNSRFKGKSKKERIRMALGAYYNKFMRWDGEDFIDTAFYNDDGHREFLVKGNDGNYYVVEGEYEP